MGTPKELEVYKQRGINLALTPLDRAACAAYIGSGMVEDIQQCYNLAGHAEAFGKVEVCSSPKEAMLRVREIVGKVIPPAIWGYGAAWQVAWVDWFRDRGCPGLEISEFSSRLAPHFGPIWMLDGIAVISKKFTEIHVIQVGEEYRLHRTNGPAILWEDGSCLYALHNIVGLERYCRSATPPSGNVILAEKNATIRQVLLQTFGLSAVFDSLNPKLVAVNPPGNTELYDIELEGRKLRCLRYIWVEYAKDGSLVQLTDVRRCPRTVTEYPIRPPRGFDIDNPDHVRLFSFGLPPSFSFTAET